MDILIAWITDNWELIVGIYLFVFFFVRLRRRSTGKCQIKSAGWVSVADKKDNFNYIKIDDTLNNISVGRILFNPSIIMKLGVTERIETRCSRELYLNLQKKLKGKGRSQIEEIKISELMKIRLSGEDFKIISLNEEEQVVEEKGFTEWAWDITPLKSGNKLLHLHVTLRIRKYMSRSIQFIR